MKHGWLWEELQMLEGNRIDIIRPREDINKGEMTIRHKSMCESNSGWFIIMTGMFNSSGTQSLLMRIKKKCAPVTYEKKDKRLKIITNKKLNNFYEVFILLYRVSVIPFRINMN
jgi:hypothetical protein